ncbi:MAG TPA: FAD-dependent oxidoreductase [Synergistaceae bacterium]|nr:FAD-dependent oxidoreductase [Synergistaceae bacterium]NLL41499.1 FAD-dependent oxidoreductase [Synergistaceae bacterium]HPX03834.1 FAD-dependent oxidoreductase [Synergistaceae bacterium]HQA54718.1 FAD-dependent oxidoreductase [Synergistaceae bacterium]
MRRSVTITLSLVSLLFFTWHGTAFAEERRYDVAVIGAGSGGCSAAIQAARMGMSVALVEESDWIGGQMTGAAVSTMDDKTKTRTGIYLEFITKVREYYSARNTNYNICYWGSDTIAFEPWVGQMILKDMLGQAGPIDIILKAKLLSAKVADNTIRSVNVQVDGKNINVSARVFIDATECGDLIALSGAMYRAGNSVSPNIDKNAIIQDITYPAVIKRYREGLPPELKVQGPPPRYTDYLFEFRMTIRKNGNTWPGQYPFSPVVHNAYRAIPDPSNSAFIDGGKPETWPKISKTAINWANDYPGKSGSIPGLSVEFLESPNFRALATKEAMLKTLAFLYYLQTELGLSDWSVDNRQGYGGWFSTDWANWAEIPERYHPILSHFPPFPYLRESRRIVGIKTMTVDDIIRDEKLGRTLVSKPHSLALGEYPIDIHGNNDSIYLETDLGETREKIPNDWEGEGGLFQIPFEIFVPEKMDGLVAAEKNISVSRVVNGSTRLQPVTMLTGQAAGAIAALAVTEKVQPRRLRPIAVQSELWRAKCRLSLFDFEDVPNYSPSWAGVEAAMLYGFMDPLSERFFGVYDEMHWVEVRDVFRKAFGIEKFPRKELQGAVTQEDLSVWIGELFEKDIARYRGIIDGLVGDKPLTKGKLAATVLALMKAAPEQGDKKK